MISKPRLEATSSKASTSLEKYATVVCGTHNPTMGERWRRSPWAREFCV